MATEIKSTVTLFKVLIAALAIFLPVNAASVGRNTAVDPKDGRAKTNPKRCLYNVTNTKDLDPAQATGIDIYKNVCRATGKNGNKICPNDLQNVKSKLVDGIQDLEIGLSLKNEWFYFGCDNDAKNLEDFEQSSGFECFRNNTQNVDACIRSISEDGGIPKTSDIAKELNHQQHSEGQKCNTLGKLRKCVVKTLRNCRPTTPARILDMLFLQMGTIVGCSL